MEADPSSQSICTRVTRPITPAPSLKCSTQKFRTGRLSAFDSQWVVKLAGAVGKGMDLVSMIAACWADNRGIPQIVFKPDWIRHRNAAPFKRNDQMLEALLIGIIAFPGSGISQNFVDKARKMGIAVWKFGNGEGSA